MMGLLLGSALGTGICAGGGSTVASFEFVAETTGPAESFTIPCNNVGDFEAVIDWGDSSTSSISSYDDADLAHVYAEPGEHTIRISGTFPNIFFIGAGDCLKVKRVLQFGRVGWQDLYQAFSGCANLGAFASGNVDTSGVANMHYMFYGCGSLAMLDASGWDTSAAGNIRAMFFGCVDLVSLDVSGWDVSGVESMDYLFYGCSSLAALDVSGWDTSAVPNMDSVFFNCSSLTGLVISGWDIGALTTAVDFLNGADNALSTAEYDAALIAWAAQAPANAVPIHFGDAQYTPGGAAEAARSALVSTYGWTITDGGAA